MYTRKVTVKAQIFELGHTPYRGANPCCTWVCALLKNITRKLPYMLENNMASEKMLDEIVHVIASTMCADYKDGYVSMGEQRMPAEVVRSIFLKLNMMDIEYFIDCFNRQTESVTMLTAYIRTSLFRNFGTIDHHYTNRVRVDMPQFAGKKIQSKWE